MNDRERHNARRGLMIYFAVLVVGSAFFEWKILRIGESIDKVPLLIIALMYAPAAASLASRLCLREGFKDISFRLGGREGKWAVQIMLSYVETKEQADALCDKIVPVVQEALRGAVPPPLSIPSSLKRQ